MLSLLIISNNPKAKLIQDFIQPLVETPVSLVADFEDGLNEVFDKSPATVIIQERIAGVTCDAIARYIKQMLGTDAPNFIMIHEDNAKVSHVKGLFEVFVDLNQPNETLVAEVSSIIKRIIGGEQVTDADLPQTPSTSVEPANVPVETAKATTIQVVDIPFDPLEPAVQKLSVLLVEDNIIGQRVALTMLSNLGCEVDIVPDGQKAIHALELINYDMVLMDWMMPRMDGLEATIKIRDKQSNVLNHDVPIIALTSNTKPGDREKCLVAGMTDYLAKPVKKAYLAEVIEKWVRKPGLSTSDGTDAVEASSPEQASGRQPDDAALPGTSTSDELASPLFPEAQSAESLISPVDNTTAEMQTAEKAGNANRSQKKKTPMAAKELNSAASDQVAGAVEPATTQDVETVEEFIAGSEENDLATRQPLILLVEDNLIGQRVALTMLNNLGCKVDVVPDGQKAIHALKLINYDMVLMDWMMPRMDGLEATAHIRDKQSSVLNHAVPIIALTSNTQPGDRDKCLDAGMSDYLEKPVKKAYLAEVIEKWLKKPVQSGSVDAEADVPETSSPELDANMQVDDAESRGAPASEESGSESIDERNNSDRLQLEESFRRIEYLENTLAGKVLEVEEAKEQLHTERVARKEVDETLQQTCNAADTLTKQLQAEVDERIKVEEALEQAWITAETAREQLQAECDELIQAEKLHSESENNYHDFIQTVMDGFWLVDNAGQLLEVNNVYCRMSGYSESELLAMNVSDLEVSDVAADITSYMHEMITDDDELFETKHRRKDGSVFNVEIHARHRTSGDGLVVVFVRDITGRIETEQIVALAKVSADVAEERLQAECAVRLDAEETLSRVRITTEAANSEAEAVIKQMQTELDDWKHVKNNLEQVATERTRKLAIANEQLQIERTARKDAEDAMHQSILAAEALNKQVEIINEYLQTERSERQQVENRLKEEQELLAKVVADMQSMPAETVNESIATRVTNHKEALDNLRQGKPAAWNGGAASSIRSRFLTYLLTAVVVLCALAGGWYLFNMKPKSPLLWDRSKKAEPTAAQKTTARTQVAVKSPATPVSVSTPASIQSSKSATKGTAKPDSSVPSFVTVSGRDSKFSAGNPGWERYVDAKHDIRIYREGGRLRAVQVLAAKGYMIEDSFMRTALHEVAGTSDYKSVSSEAKNGFVVQRNSVGATSRLIMYREQHSNKISAFVVQFD